VAEFFSVEILHSITVLGQKGKWWEDREQMWQRRMTHSMSCCKVDTNIDRKLPISLDITFPHMRCSEALLSI
jgi:hypothetical protein